MYPTNCALRYHSMLGPVRHLLKKANREEQETKLLQFVEKNNVQLSNLVNEILDLSKLENNKMQLKEEPVQFYTFLKDRMNQYHSFGLSKQLTFETKFPNNGDLQILIDKAKFEKITNNFLSNAMKFTPSGGKVVLMVDERNQDIQLSVADTGRGIHSDDLPHVFDRFYQSKNTDAPVEGGTGIGLSLTRELAHLMDGKVWAESTLGEGSTFYFTFPKKLAIPEWESTAATPIDPQKVDSGTLDIVPDAVFAVHRSEFASAHILVAEDNVDLREYYKIILSDFNVITTEHGQAALDYLNQNDDTPKLIISDLMMPVMDGMQLLERLKSNQAWRNIPVIMLTAKANRQLKIKALRIGIDDYLTKPFDEEELVVRIENLLRNCAGRALSDLHGANEIHGSVEHHFIEVNEEQNWLETLEKHVRSNIDDSRFGMDFLSDLMDISRRQLQRRIKKLVGLTPKEYINEIRLYKARVMIEEGKAKTIKEVASKCGFSSSDYFSQQFKKRFGKSPSTYAQ